MKDLSSKFGWVVTVVLLAAGCASLPAIGTTPAPQASETVATTAPAATVAPGSTQAPGLEPTSSANAGPMETSPAGPTVDATEPPATAENQAATTVPEPTLPPAPTAAEPTPAATRADAAPAAQIACTPGALTPSQTEGPYYKANPPEASSLLQPGMGGTTLAITGYVLDAACQPVPGARVDFWQADAEGQYDNQGYTLRGYEVTDAEGRYTVETVIPGLYPGRTRHIHVKVNAPGGPVLTTQLYFADEPANQSDQIFNPALVLEVAKTAAGEKATFNFVINTK